MKEIVLVAVIVINRARPKSYLFMASVRSGVTTGMGVWVVSGW